jgi:hypothetical protein
MRGRTLFTISVSAFLVLAGGIVAGGCGDTDDTTKTPPTADSSTDGKTSSDAKAEAAPVECSDADITQLTVNDASLGDGGSSVGTCSACIKTNCLSELQACQEDCDCRDSVVGFFQCVSTGKAITACGGGLLTAGAMAQALGLCAVNSGCTAACGQGGGDDASTGTDSGSVSDAPSDG